MWIMWTSLHFVLDSYGVEEEDNRVQGFTVLTAASISLPSVVFSLLPALALEPKTKLFRTENISLLFESSNQSARKTEVHGWSQYSALTTYCIMNLK